MGRATRSAPGEVRRRQGSARRRMSSACGGVESRRGMQVAVKYKRRRILWSGRLERAGLGSWMTAERSSAHGDFHRCRSSLEGDERWRRLVVSTGVTRPRSLRGRDGWSAAGTWGLLDLFVTGVEWTGVYTSRKSYGLPSMVRVGKGQGPVAGPHRDAAPSSASMGMGRHRDN
mgnify:CR=1 FL=1